MSHLQLCTAKQFRAKDADFIYSSKMGAHRSAPGTTKGGMNAEMFEVCFNWQETSWSLTQIMQSFRKFWGIFIINRSQGAAPRGELGFFGSVTPRLEEQSGWLIFIRLFCWSRASFRCGCSCSGPSFPRTRLDCLNKTAALPWNRNRKPP